MEEKIPFKENDRTGRWKSKEYSKKIMAYVDQSLKPDEQNMYKTLFDSLADRFNIFEPNELMLLDLAINDYIRVKRLHLVLKEESDIINITTRAGQVVRKAHEAGYLINAIEGQFRQNMKELMLTPKEKTKKLVQLASKDFSSAITTIIEADVVDEKDEEQDGTIQPTISKTEGKKEEPRSSIRESKPTN